MITLALLLLSLNREPKVISCYIFPMADECNYQLAKHEKYFIYWLFIYGVFTLMIYLIDQSNH